MSIGEAIFGYDGPGGGSAEPSSSPAGCTVVRIVRRISRSTLVGAMAGLPLIADGASVCSARHCAARHLPDVLRGGGVRRAGIVD